MTKFVWSGVEDGAPETELFGRLWQANVPQEASDKQTIPQDVSERQVQTDGRVLLITKTVMVSEAEMLRGNPCFDEVGQPPKEHKKPGRIKALNAAEEGSQLLTLE